MAESNYNTDSPYYVEYARSSRSKCKGCFKVIDELNPRIAVLVQSHWTSGKMPQWYHFDCFFQEYHPKTKKEIANYENMRRWERVEIKGQIALNNLPGEYEEESSEEHDSDEDYLSDEEDEDVVEVETTSTKKKKT